MTGILDFLTGDKLAALAEGNFSFGIPVDFPLLIVGAVLVRYWLGPFTTAPLSKFLQR